LFPTKVSSLSKETRPSFSVVFSMSSIYFSEFHWFFSQLFFAEIASFLYFIFKTIFFSFLWSNSDKSLGRYTLIFCTLLHQPNFSMDLCLTLLSGIKQKKNMGCRKWERTSKIWHLFSFSRISLHSFFSWSFPTISSLSWDTRPSFSLYLLHLPFILQSFIGSFLSCSFAKIASFLYFIFKAVFFSFLWANSDKSLEATLLFSAFYCTAIIFLWICIWPPYLLSNKWKI